MATEVKPNVFARFGNDLHSGARSYPFIGKRRLWLLLAVLLMAGVCCHTACKRWI